MHLWSTIGNVEVIGVTKDREELAEFSSMYQHFTNELLHKHLQTVYLSSLFDNHSIRNLKLHCNALTLTHLPLLKEVVDVEGVQNPPS